MIIADGRIVADGTPAELESQSPYHNAVLIECQNDGVAEALRAMAGVTLVDELPGGRFRAYPSAGQSIVADVADLIKQQNWSTSRLSVEQPRLDEVFRNITGAKDTNNKAGNGNRGEAA
jgi:ABC-2 type transport system ATP-binding protein